MTPDTIEPTKRCSKCDEAKPFSAYHRHKQIKCGLCPSCKVCVNARNKEWRGDNPLKARSAIKAWWEAHPEKRKEKAAKRLAKNPSWAREYYEANKEKVASKSRAHYIANKPKRSKQQKAWHKANKGRASAYKARWARENPTKICVYNQTRRAAQVAAGGSHSPKEIAALLVDQRHLCSNPFCNADLRTVKRHLDHKQPLVAGGSNGISNLQWLCAPCNLSKGRRDQESWLVSLECKEAA